MLNELYTYVNYDDLSYNCQSRKFMSSYKNYVVPYAKSTRYFECGFLGKHQIYVAKGL